MFVEAFFKIFLYIEKYYGKIKCRIMRRGEGMDSVTRICATITAIFLLVGCWLGIDSLGVKIISGQAALVTETPTTLFSQQSSSLVFSDDSVDTDSVVTSVFSSVISSNSSVITSSMLSSLKPESSFVSSSVSSRPVSSAPSSSVQKPVVTVKKDQNLTEIVNYIKRPTYSSVQTQIKKLAEEYPDLIELSSIGESVQGRDLTLLKLGTGETKACIIAGIHARESITVSYLMRCVEEFCVAYQSETGKFAGYNIKKLLDKYTLYLVPLANPDGLEIISARAKPEVNITYCGDMTIKDYKANANGVNLNKNFPLLWQSINNTVVAPDPEGYKGPSVASEPETKALMQLCNQNDFAWMTSIHVRGDCVYWSDSVSPSVGCSEKIVNALEQQCDFYKCLTSEDVNGFGGGFENWFRKQFNRPGLCLELMPLDIEVTPLTNQNHQYFSNTVRWDITKKVIPLLMTYGE